MKNIICGSTLFTLLLFGFGNCFGGSLSVSIRKEILLAPGEFFTPTSLNTTPDQELIVTASWPGAKTGLATKVSLDGAVRWTYRWKDALAQPPSAQVIVGSAVLPNGEVLLCGNETIGSTSKDEHDIQIKGRLSKLNAQGELIEATSALPPSPFDVHFRGLVQCGRWGDGAYAVGFGFRVFPYAGDATKPHINTSESFLWVIRTDAIGKIIWEKVIPTNSNVGPHIPQPQVLPNGDLLVVGNGQDAKAANSQSTDLVILSPDGGIQARRNIAGGVYVGVRRTTPALPIMLFLAAPDGVHSQPQAFELDGSLRTIAQHEMDKYWGKFGYFCCEGKQLVKFGTREVMGLNYRGMVSVDLLSGKQIEIALPGNGRDKYEIDDVTALGQDNQFAFTASRVDTSIKPSHAIGITVLELK